MANLEQIPDEAKNFMNEIKRAIQARALFDLEFDEHYERANLDHLLLTLVYGESDIKVYMIEINRLAIVLSTLVGRSTTQYVDLAYRTHHINWSLWAAQIITVITDQQLEIYLERWDQWKHSVIHDISDSTKTEVL